MKALAEQIGDIDGVQIYRRFRRTRADGRSRRANSCDVARRTLEIVLRTMPRAADPDFVPARRGRGR